MKRPMRRICWNCVILELIAFAIVVYFVIWYQITVHPHW